MSCENHIQVGSKLQRRACGSSEEERYRPMGRRAALLLVLVLLAPIPAEVRLPFLCSRMSSLWAEERVTGPPASKTV
jgi:hypothetical protein